jgi:hypothetical protein
VAYLAREAKQHGREADPAASSEAQLDRAVDYISRSDTGACEVTPFYNAKANSLDAKALTAAWADDARHFRLIVSPEDGEALGDLRPFVREVISGLEAKLGTKLEWLAANHYDTDNPHAHVLIRGRRSNGHDLFIPSRLISSGIREHAQEIATRVLGPRQDVDLARERSREMRAVTSIDRELVRLSGQDQLIGPARPDLTARLEQLEAWDLSQRTEAGWKLADRVISRLKAMADYDAVEQAVFAGKRDRKPLLEAEPNVAVMGELVHAGPVDDLGERLIAVIETGRGELRYTELKRPDDMARLDGAPTGAVVELQPLTPAVRPSDKTVARVAAHTGGLYSEGHHRSVTGRTDARLIEGNIRRLEAMRRVGLVNRRPDGVFEISPDHLEKAVVFEQRLAARAPLSARVASYWTLAEQIDALGPTHLDRVLARETAPLGGGDAVARAELMALQQRRLFLIEQGWMGAGDQTLGPSVLPRMAELERRTLADKLAKELGVRVSTTQHISVRGVYARRIDLAQGRVALIVGDRAAHIVPWRPSLERFAGREVEGLIRGRSLSWGLAPNRGPSLPPM